MLSRYSVSFLLLLLGGGLRAAAQAPLTQLGTIALPSYGVELAVTGTTAYVLCASAGTQQLRVYDVSTPTAPQLLSTLALPTGSLPALPPRHAVVSNGTLYVSSFPTPTTTPHSVLLWIIDVTSPTAPSLRKSYQAVGSDELFLAATGNSLYTVFDNSNQLNVYDSNLTYVRTVGLPYSLSGILGLSVTGTTAYVQYANPSFATLDLTLPSNPISSAGTTPGTISAASNALAYGLAQPAYPASVASNTLRFYSLTTPLQPVLLRTQAGSFGTRVAAGGQSVFTVGATSPYLAAAPSSSEPLRGYYSPTSGASPLAASSPAVQGANALAAANNFAYLLTDTSLSIYAFPSTVTAVRPAVAALSLYPNPAHDQLTFPQQLAGELVSIYDVTGRCCLQATLSAQRTLDIRSLRAGLYQVRTPTASSKLLVD